jgi:hypothetical protein
VHQSLLESVGVRWSPPEHVGECKVLLEKVRAILHASQLPKFLWGEAVKHAVYLKNRTSTKALDGKTPYEAPENPTCLVILDRQGTCTFLSSSIKDLFSAAKGNSDY